MSEQFTDEQRRVLDRVHKLLALAGRNTSQAEAESAAAKASALLAEHNLTMASVDESGAGEGGRRAKEYSAGGGYEYERALWGAVAEANFCMHFVVQKWERRTKRDARTESYVDPHLRENRRVWRHMLVGRQVNIAATRAMAGYLQQTIERLTRDRLRERLGTESVNTQMRSRWAVSYREGAAWEMVGRLREQVRAQATEDQRRQEEARQAAERAGMAGASDGTAVTISSVRKTERDANVDHVWGDGTAARWARERADRSTWDRMDEDARTRWAADHPEEAARLAEEDRVASRSRGGGGGSGRERDWGAYRAGHEAARSVSLHRQADDGRAGSRLAENRTLT